MKLQGCVKGTNVAAQVNEQVSSERSQNRHALLQILSTLKFLCRQGLPIRGHEHSAGNFQELLRLRSEDDRQSWL